MTYNFNNDGLPFLPGCSFRDAPVSQILRYSQHGVSCLDSLKVEFVSSTYKPDLFKSEVNAVHGKWDISRVFGELFRVWSVGMATQLVTS